MKHFIFALFCLFLMGRAAYSAPKPVAKATAVPAATAAPIPVAPASPVIEKKTIELPDFSIYHISYLGSLTNSSKKVINVFNGDILDKGIFLSYNGVIGIEKRIFHGLSGYFEYGFSQHLIDASYGGPTDATYIFQNGSSGKLTGKKVENNFRLTAGLSYSIRMRSYLIFQLGLGYVNVNQLTYIENRVSQPITVTTNFGINSIAQDSKKDSTKTDATFHGFAVAATFWLTPRGAGAPTWGRRPNRKESHAHPQQS